ncbi:hypothetical protein HanRHA438_Chr09g0405501 [Helianthus annuus]|nr:hypothetical protein HanRHA438_Chr09g0405501 [Helianthus annuus]
MKHVRRGQENGVSGSPFNASVLDSHVCERIIAWRERERSSVGIGPTPYMRQLMSN